MNDPWDAADVWEGWTPFPVHLKLVRNFSNHLNQQDYVYVYWVKVKRKAIYFFKQNIRKPTVSR